MKKYLQTGGMLKLLSVFIAIFLWVVVIDNDNPIVSVDLSIPLKVENEGVLLERGLGIKERNFPLNVAVSIKGRKSKIFNIDSDDIEAIVDMADIKDINTKVLYIKIGINKSGVSLENVTPSTVSLTVEKIGQNCFPVEVVTLGDVRKGYKIIGAQAIPENVAIHEGDAVLKLVGNLKTFVDVNGSDKDIVTKKYCTVYNKNGAEMPELSKKVITNVKIEIAKEVPIVAVVTGRPSPNYVDGSPIVTPEMALLTGEPSILDKVDNIKTEPINIDNATQTVTKACVLVVPDGVNLVDRLKNALIKVLIEPMDAKKFNYAASSINIVNSNSSYKYNILTKNIVVTVKGMKTALSNILQPDLHPRIDVRGLKEGKCTTALRVSLPVIVKLAEEVEVELDIIKK